MGGTHAMAAMRTSTPMKAPVAMPATLMVDMSFVLPSQSKAFSTGGAGSLRGVGTNAEQGEKRRTGGLGWCGRGGSRNLQEEVI